MTEALQVHQGAAALSVVGRWTVEQVQVIRETVARGATEAELRLFLAVCGRTGLDPFTKQIYLVKRWDKQQGKEVMAIQTGIDGFRVIAQRSNEYQGQVPVQWCGPDASWRDLWTDDKPPFAARVGVWRKGFREPLYATARWSAYVQKKKDGDANHFWTTMGPEQLAKCAEALALRKAFPNELSGLYTREEMQQAESEAKSGAAEVVAEPTRPIQEAEFGVAAMLAGPRDYNAEFVSLCREHGFIGRGKKLDAVNLILRAINGPESSAILSSPKADDPFYREAVEWVEAHGWPKPEPLEIPESWQPFAAEPLPDAYFSHSKGEAIPIDGMALPHLERAIQQLDAAIKGVLPADPHNGPKVLEALKLMRSKRRGEAVDEAQRKVVAT